MDRSLFEIAEGRVDIIEAALFESNDTNNTKNNSKLLTRIQKLDTDFANTISKIPHFQNVIESISKVGLQGNSSSSTLGDVKNVNNNNNFFGDIELKLNEILISRKQLDKAINDLEYIQNYKSILNNTSATDFIPDNYQKIHETLTRMENHLTVITHDVDRQTLEIDRILDIYENLIIKISDYCADLDWKLRLFKV